MTDNVERAKELFAKGYNCSQSIVGAYHKEMGLDFETALKLSSSFGGGMGRLREVCGGLTGIFMVVGMKYGYSDPDDYEAKKNHYELIWDMAEKFKEKNNTIICRELLGLDDDDNSPIPEKRSANYYKTRSCINYIEDAAKILEDIFSQTSP